MTTPTTTDHPSDWVISLLRTAVPVVWGFVVSWLVGLGIPASVLSKVHDLVIAAMTAVLASAWYALWRWLEPRLPKWLVAVLLGYPLPPIYHIATK